MAGETPITLVGNLTADPELRFTPNGAAVANFTVASTPRTFDRQANEFKDGDTLFMRCSAWRDLGENAAESFHRGDRIVVTGRVKQRSFETKEGEKRTVIEVDAEDVAGSVKHATVKVQRTQRGGNNSTQQPSGGQAQQAGGDPWATSAPSGQGSQQAAQAPVNDPWADPAPTPDEPPF